jgi:SAM domain (Sterile alpha motif)
VKIAAWLNSLGMQQYEEAFRESAIDGAPDHWPFAGACRTLGR